MAGRYGLQRSTWSNPMYGRSSWDHHMPEEYEDVELSWTVNRAKREKQRKMVKKRKAQSYNLKAILVSLVVLQILLLAVTAVILWKALDTSPVSPQPPDCDTNFCKDGPCDNGVCVEAADGFYCVCRGGWEGEFCETDVDECKTVECHPLATCENTAGSYTCECQEGYEGDGIEACTDVDECAQSDICGPNLSCFNTEGSFNCGCQQGFVLIGTTCTDIDECLEEDICGPHSISCSNTIGNYTCSCQQGFFFNRTTCVDVNECADEDICGPNSIICSNTIGSYNCSCQPGFLSSGTSCQDIDECLEEDICGPYSISCSNTMGSYNCSCQQGFSFNGTRCGVFLCGSQEDNWFLGRSITDSSWSMVANDCAQPDSFPFPTPACPKPGQAISNESSHLGYLSWHFKRGYDTPGPDSPFTTPLDARAGRKDGSYTATGDSFFASFWFKAADPSGDGSRIMVAAGNPAETDRASNYLEVYALPEGITVQTAESAPNYTYCAQYRNCGWDAHFPSESSVSGLDLETWHQVEMNLTAKPVDYMDQWQYRVDGVHTFTGGAYFQTKRYDEGWDYEYVNRLKFQPKHTNQDASFQGFFFDDIHYGVFDSTSPDDVIEEYCVSFEE